MNLNLENQTKTDEQRAQEQVKKNSNEVVQVYNDAEQQRKKDTSFEVDINELTKILDQYRTRLNGDDDIKEIEKLGGIEGLLSKLKTDKTSGIVINNVHTLKLRENHFGNNKIYEKEVPHFCYYVLDSFKDTMLQVLIVAAILQIVLGATLSDEPERDWVDGVSILIAVFVVVTVGSVTNWKKEHQFKDLSDEQKKDTVFGITREGKTVSLQSDDVLVGDIININYGEILPADAILIDGNNIKSDESALTGESNEMKKNTFEECIKKREEELKEGSDLKKITLPSPVLLSGTNIVSGSGHGVIVAVGKNSQKGQIRNMVENAQEDAKTPLEEKLEDIATTIGYFGMGAGVVTLVAMFIRFGISYPKKVDSYNETLARNSVFNAYLEAFASDLTGDDSVEKMKASIEADLTTPKSQVGGEVLNIILLCVSIIVVAIPEGLPLAVTLALAFSIRKMMDKQNLVRKMHACETMGGANIICTDKTGTLTKNEMTVTKIFNCKNEINMKDLNNQGAVGKLEKANNNQQEKVNLVDEKTSGLVNKEAAVDDYHRYFTENYFNLLKIGLGVNLVATINPLDTPDEKGRTEEIHECNKTDFAFVNFLHLLKTMILPIREKYYPKNETVKQIPFSSKRKRMSTLIASDEFPTGYRLFSKGGADFLLKNVTKIIDPDTNEIIKFDDDKNKICLDQMKRFNEETLRTLSICYKDISKEEYEGFISGQEDDPDIDKNDLTLIAIFGIKDILRPTVPYAVNQCHQAGVKVQMITGDNLYTAVAIAKECNILPEDMNMDNIEKEPDHELKNEEDKKAHYQEVIKQKPCAMTGNTFYNAIGGLVCDTCGKEAEKECKCARTAEEAKHLGIKEIRKDRIGNMEVFKTLTENLCVLARSQPTHKYSMVLGLRALKNVIAVTGDGTNDAPALSKSDVGFAMGKAGTDIAKEASDIIILDDDFSSIIVAILWGRNIYDNIRKFLQFQLTVNFCACILVFLCACIGNETPLIPIQMLWVNLIMDSLGSLSLATEAPYDELLLRPPTKRKESIINGKMWKHIIFQATFQLVILLLLYLIAPKFIKETDKIRLSENYIIKHCYGKLPDNGDIDHIINGSKSKWDSETALKPGMNTLECGGYAKKQDLSIAYKYYINCNSGSVHMTVLFNVFVYYTLFNQLNARMLDDSFNIFKRIFSNLYFPLIFIGEGVLQAILVLFGKTVFHTAETGLTGEQWGICFGFSAITFLVSILAKLIPIDVPIQRWLDRMVEKEENEEETKKAKSESTNEVAGDADKVSINTNQQLIPMSDQGKEGNSGYKKLLSPSNIEANQIGVSGNN